MIRCSLSQFERTCRKRGCSVKDAMRCVVSVDGEKCVVDELHHAYPRDRSRPWQPIPIGDVVERWLTRVGITKERVERWTRTEGKSGGCGCEGRKKWLNEWGNRVQIAARQKLLKVHAFYFGS